MPSHGTLNATILAMMRSGSSFLAQSLDSHPDMVWDRYEPLLEGCEWRLKYPGAYYNTITGLYREMEGKAAVIGMKMTYVQLTPAAWHAIETLEPRIINLQRKNVLRWAVSALVNQEHADRPGHTDNESLPLARIHVPPQVVLRLARTGEALQARVARRLGDFPHVLTLDYSDVVGGEGNVVEGPTPEAAERMCGFLGVEAAPLRSPRRGVNRYPMRDIFENWVEVRRAILNSEFARFLEDERGWRQKGDV